MLRRRGPEGPRRFSFSPFTATESAMALTDVLIFDTTLRDGEQAPGNSLSPEEKLRLARQLDALGVDVMEAGFPAASEGDYRSVREIAAEIRRPGHRRAGALPRAGHRARRRGAASRRRAAGSTCSSRPPTCTSGKSCGPRGRRCWRGRARRSAGRASTPTTSSSPPRTPAGPIPTSSAGWCRPRSRRAPRTVNLPDTVGYAMPAEYGDDVPRRAGAGAGGRTAWC